MSVFANKRKIVHKGNGLVETCPAPDVCKTPSPGGPVPIPYVNIANDSDLADGTKDVKIEGNMVGLKGANLAMSSGDEGGTAGGGIVSSKIKGKMTWMLYSTDVIFENQGVVRFMEPMMHNGNASNVPNPQHLGGHDGTYPCLRLNSNCPRCGQPIAQHDPGFELPQTQQTHDMARDFRKELMRKAPKHLSKRGHMLGILVVRCPGGRTQILAGISGGPVSGWAKVARSIGAVAVHLPKPNEWAQRFPNQTEPPGGNPVGNCAAPRMIAHAQKNGCTPLAMTEVWAGQDAGIQTDAHRAPSCGTCKANLPHMLCPNPPANNPQQNQPDEPQDQE